MVAFSFPRGLRIIILGVPVTLGLILGLAWGMIAPVSLAQAEEENPRATGIPDGYGYNWNNAVSFKWIEATGGQKIFPKSGDPSNQFYDDAISDPLPIGFSFPFYEDAFNQVFVTTNGIIGFREQLGDNNVHFVNFPIPNDGPPQGFIAPYWDDLTLGGETNQGAIYTLQGQESGQKYFVVEWHEVSRRGEDATLLFQTILYENGDILFSYATLSVTLDSETIGIEDLAGVNGLQYQYNDSGLGVFPGMTIKITRPTPAYRAKAFPRYQGGLVESGKVEHQVFIRNAGNSTIGGGVDAFSLVLQSLDAGWTGQVLNTAGTTQISQTPNLAPGQVYTATIRLFPPQGAPAGSDTQADLVVTSTKDNQKKATIRLDGAVPSPFVSVSSNDLTGIEMRVTSENRTTPRTIASFFTGSTFGIFNGSDNLYVFAQEKNGRATVSPFRPITEIEFLILDRSGNVILPFKEVADHSLSTIRVYDTLPQFATAPYGTIGVTWLRTEVQITTVNTETITLRRDNIYFALFSSSGVQIGTEKNLTNNPDFGGDQTPDLVTFESPEIQATSDNTFVVAFVERHLLNQSTETTDIAFTIINGYNGNVLFGSPVIYTAGQPESLDFFDPALVGLDGTRVLLVFSVFDSVATSYQIRYRQVTSTGSYQGVERTLSGEGGFATDGIRLSNGNTLLAWTNTNGQISAAILDANFGATPLFGPVELPTPDGRRGANVSVTHDRQGNGILIWEDATFGFALYYALLNTSGILTPPMIFEYGATRETTVQTNRFGAGIASYIPYGVYLPVIRR